VEFEPTRESKVYCVLNEGTSGRHCRAIITPASDSIATRTQHRHSPWHRNLRSAYSLYGVS